MFLYVCVFVCEEYEYADSLKSDLPAVINWQEILESDKKGENTKVLHKKLRNGIICELDYS